MPDRCLQHVVRQIQRLTFDLCMSEKEFLLTAGKSIIAFDGLPPLFTYQLTIFMFTNINMHQNGIFFIDCRARKLP
jgi:hypothetical protein